MAAKDEAVRRNVEEERAADLNRIILTRQIVEKPNEI
jgi:hypothetical protein